MNSERINEILNNIEFGYDQMADKFSGTRKNFWADLEFIKNYIDNGDNVLDFGCGNGRLLEILKDKKINYTGADISQKLIELAKRKYPEFSDNFSKISGQSSLSFPDNFFNKIISIAVFHHFPEKYAKDMAKELYRIIQPGGAAIITIWNLWNKKRRGNILNPVIIIKKIFHIGEYAGFGFGDVLIPFQDNKGEIFKRYHRVYTEKSLSAVFLSAGFEIEKCFLANEKNIVIIVKKKI